LSIALIGRWTLKRKGYWSGIIDRSFLFVNRKHF